MPMRVLQIALALIIGGAVLVATFGGGGLLLVRHAPTIVEGWASRSWPGTAAVIQRSTAVHKYSPSGWSRSGIGTHVVSVGYAFEVDGRPYAGSRRSLDDEGKVLSEAHATKAAARLPVGAAVTAYYDPSDPAKSLLERGVPVGGVLGSLFGLILIGAGITPIVLGLRIRSHLAKRRGRRKA